LKIQIGIYVRQNTGESGTVTRGMMVCYTRL